MSPEMIHWQHLPIALAPTKGPASDTTHNAAAAAAGRRQGGIADYRGSAEPSNRATSLVGQSEEAPPAACPETSAAASTRKT